MSVTDSDLSADHFVEAKRCRMPHGISLVNADLTFSICAYWFWRRLLVSWRFGTISKVSFHGRRILKGVNGSRVGTHQSL
jgi:hypothetical protein